MTATAHVLVAGAIASKFPDPLQASLLAFCSHFIMDSIPHWDIGTQWRSRSKKTTGLLAIFETIVGIGIGISVFANSSQLTTLLFSIFFSLLPDWLETPWYIFFAHQKKHEPSPRADFTEKITFWIYKMENRFHAKTTFLFGVITQVVTVAFFLRLLA